MVAQTAIPHGTGPSVLVRGAGVSGLTAAVTLAERGARVSVHECGGRVGWGASWKAGGMLAPWCEAESATPEVTAQSLASLDWWDAHVPGVDRNGTLVLAPPRDVREIMRFARRTSHFSTIGEGEIAQMEPDLADRFSRALFFAGEGHVNPRDALNALAARVVELGGSLRFNVPVDAGTAGYDWVVDCTGIAARDRMTDMRGVRGEMLLLRCPDVTLHRPVRMLHPRIPIYVVPRAGHVYMVGATMIESENAGPMTLRSMVEMLGAVYALHPAFGEAEILETGTGLRPSYPDNMPAVRRQGRHIHINGMYRHGFLLSPVRAAEAADIVFGES
ncbi:MULTISPECIES: FAD-dependent oxidoreductase [Komagataeibacter]|uniref:D-amino-acid oxidase n=1 Tax=Komagataeibacter oboediens TaxID=65958 RepID=A0A318QYE6_9PROT|nr:MULTISPECIES: FAD-dependent oxidoreductase [Komagataeibacter]GBR31561.1 thiamine biosynthesis oxidoreductase ThiO [Komagataeibacter oboediens DSM 11826]MBL7232840.1 FAD-dependent oxidoreductase [Komagataeibacter oboediens]MBT0675583.1 FAD-dependent oxidoreductase [Komagataeibacter oboediens]MBT0679076.1 FAD-dependent oxidoreductase [Komagataeibacter oboediens]MBV1823317.1 FAD-dependent oxidoreductase [Komagataeibacter oboediens]